MDAQKNFAYSSVAAAPSPADTGTSLVVAAAEGVRFPAVPFDATVWPTGAQPLPTNAEMVRVTAIATDTLTIVRARQGSTARLIVVTDQIAATIHAKGLAEPYVRDAPGEDVYVPAGYSFLAGDELDCATSNIEIQIDGEVVFT